LSAPVECKVEIKAVFWQHPLFIWGMAIIFMGLVILSIIRRKNLQIRKRDLDHQLITLEQKALQSMMNPHFIFNSLGSIQTYILQKKSLEAGMYLSQFARLIRQNLNAINAANISLEEEVDRLRNYLDLEMLRMENKFEYHIEMEENLATDEIMIPSMIVQPFVENAIWHGISTLEEKGEITVGFRKLDEKSLKITIMDNGIGMQKSQVFSPKSEKHFHLGMEMTRRRLELLGKKYAINTSIQCCEVSPGSPNPGTKVVLVVPISA
jgi:sensor histidine kinase YesM